MPPVDRPRPPGRARRAVTPEQLAQVRHDLRTPLNAISGWTELLKQEPDDVQTVKEGMGAIERNVRVQTQLIEDLLDMSRITSGKVRLEVRSINLADVIHAAIETVAPATRAKVGPRDPREFWTTEARKNV